MDRSSTPFNTVPKHLRFYWCVLVVGYCVAFVGLAYDHVAYANHWVDSTQLITRALGLH